MSENLEDLPPARTTDAPAWRPYGYTDAATGTSNAAGAAERIGPTTPAGPDELLVPDNEATREAEQHPGAVVPASEDEGGDAGPGAPAPIVRAGVALEDNAGGEDAAGVENVTAGGEDAARDAGGADVAGAEAPDEDTPGA